MTDPSEIAQDRERASVDFAEVIDELLAIIETAKSVPLSSSVLVSRDEVTDILLSAREAIPVELSRAKRLLIERNEIWAQAERDANALIDEARAQAAHLVQRTEVVRQANSHAERLIAEAQASAYSIRREAEDFIDKRLAAAEIVIDRAQRTLQVGREKLKLNHAHRVGIAPSKEADTNEPMAGAVGLYDQDNR
ncbi:MAG TPA: hypothetical protein VMU99_03815 [Acidimicrobiales bacterium]|nr:hypothetical protein [Acidimicrobiales bacterium]